MLAPLLIAAALAADPAAALAADPPASMTGDPWVTEYMGRSPAVALFPSRDITPHKNLGMFIGHTWGTGAQADTSVALGFTWGFWNRLDVGLLHNTGKTENVVELRGSLLRQEGHEAWGKDALPSARGASAPLSLVAIGGAAFRMDDELPTEEAMGFYGQLVAAESLWGPWLTVALVPTVAVLPAADGATWQALNAAAGASFTLRPSNNWSAVADVAGVGLTGDPGLAWSAGLRGYTAGHTFTLTGGNLYAPGVLDYAARPAGPMPGGVAIGLMLTRDFGP